MPTVTEKRTMANQYKNKISTLIDTIDDLKRKAQASKELSEDYIRLNGNAENAGYDNGAFSEMITICNTLISNLNELDTKTNTYISSLPYYYDSQNSDTYLY